jgi:catechol 2,3-dioxygenase-like lactoylglutathione lyase family enzyme
MGKVVSRVSDTSETLVCANCEEPLTGGFVRLWPPTNFRVCYECIDWMNSQRALQLERSGGPVPVVGHEPVFRVSDVPRAVEHYQRLGFRTEHHDEGYAFAQLGNLTVHLAQDDAVWPGYEPQHHMTSVLYLHVEDADRLAADWRAAGMAIHGPRNEDYGKREGQHVDPDGNLIRFGSPIPSPQ